MLSGLKTLPAQAPDPGFGIYVHWPFCLSKCPYCDFNSHVRERIDHREWLSSYLKEIAHYRSRTGKRTVTSIFFGGGTPSLMEPKTVETIIDAIAQEFDLLPAAEITLEANPTSVEANKFKEFRAAGINRVSIGIQALNDTDLKALGRQHSAAEGRQALALAAATFDRFSFDLIYARPDQSLRAWEKELDMALKLAATHLSLYQLTIEEGTQFHTLHQRGELVIPDDNQAGALYEITQEMTDKAGLAAYEISNHARPGHESRHNLTYWRYGDYLGIGPGAHGRLTLEGKKIATRTHRAPEIWLERVAKDGHGAHLEEIVEPDARGTEMVMMGLRLAEGIDLIRLEAETGKPPDRFFNTRTLDLLIAEGFLTWKDNTLCATPQGRQRLNSVLSMILGQ